MIIKPFTCTLQLKIIYQSIIMVIENSYIKIFTDLIKMTRMNYIIYFHKFVIFISSIYQFHMI